MISHLRGSEGARPELREMARSKVALLLRRPAMIHASLLA
ncbi:unnamed protein product, partial [Vitis vinifera]